MADIGSFEEAEEFQRRRFRSATSEQRLAWLRRMQEFAHHTGALQRARKLKEETSWKYGKR